MTMWHLILTGHQNTQIYANKLLNSHIGRHVWLELFCSLGTVWTLPLTKYHNIQCTCTILKKTYHIKIQCKFCAATLFRSERYKPHSRKKVTFNEINWMSYMNESDWTYSEGVIYSTPSAVGWGWSYLYFVWQSCTYCLKIQILSKRYLSHVLA